jgi:hypothetical protein
MPNVSALEQLEAAAQYEPEGFARAVAMLKKYAPWFEHQSDSLARVVASPLTTTVTQISDSASNLYAVFIKSGSSATQDCYVQVFNVDDTDVVLGTTAPNMVFEVSATKSQVFLIVPGNDAKGTFATGLSMAATTTHDGNTALATASRPTVWVLSAT